MNPSGGPIVKFSILVKLLLAVLMAICGCGPVFAQPPITYFQFGTAKSDKAYSVSATLEGVYVVGRTDGTLAGQKNAGGVDAFIRKYDLNGNILWTRQFGSDRDDLAISVSATTTAVYVVGYTGGALPGQTSLGGSDAFIRKYDLNGNEIWTRQFGTTFPGVPYPPDDFASSVIAVDYFRSRVPVAFGIYVVGDTKGVFPGNFGTGSSSDVFIRKYDTDGNELWTRQFGTDNGVTFTNDSAGSVSTYDGLSFYVAGSTEGAFPGQSHSGGLDAFIRKFDANGNELWTHQFGSTGRDLARSVKATDTGIVYVAGNTDAALPGQSHAGGSDAFLRKYSANGSVLWTRQFGSSNDEGAIAVTGTSQEVFVGGTADAFIRKFDANGGGLWTGAPPASANTVVWGLSLIPGNVYFVGQTDGTIPGQMSGGSVDAYMAITNPN
jgi:hypothetical protein